MARLDRVDLQLSLLVLVWGSAFVGIKVLGTALDPYQMTWYRYLPFPILYGAYLLGRKRHVFPTVEGRHWPLIAILGFLGVVGYHFPLNWGLHGGAESVSGATGSILIATNPLWTLLLAVGVGRERFRARTLLGFAVAFLGVAIVVLLGKGHAELTLAGRATIILLAPMSWAVYTVLSKPLVDRYGGLFVAGTTLSLGTLMLLPLGVGYGVEPLLALTGPQVFWLLFLALISTAAGYAVWNDALQHRKASDVAVFVYAQPVVTALIGALPSLLPIPGGILADEPLTVWFAVGAALVLAGVVWVNRQRLAAPPAAPAKAPAENA
jgi:drug/metabolite transporter (DMT)-like permease